MAVKITILGSGSKGNATVIEHNGSGIMIDAGFSARETFKRLTENEIDPQRLKAIVISHEHIDHVCGAAAISTRLGIPVFTTQKAHRALEASDQIGDDVIWFGNSQPFEIAGMTITPFPVPHDTVDAVAFVVEADGRRIGVATDLGHVNRAALRHLADCSVLILESNYDRDMLEQSGRPAMLIDRIMGRSGHLGNDEALAALEQLLTPNTKHLIMVHVSEQCNDYELVEKIVRRELKRLNREDVSLQVARQSECVSCVC